MKYTILIMSLCLLGCRARPQQTVIVPPIDQSDLVSIHPWITIVTPDNDGQDVKIDITDSVALVLPEQLGTGFSWEVKTQPENVLQVSDEREHAKTNQKLGSPTSRSIIFRAVKKGEVKLIATYSRPWEKTKKTVTIKVIVSDTN
jgi:predicted secreted protein